MRGPGVEGRRDLGVGGGGRVWPKETFHLTPEGRWAGVSSVGGGGAGLSGRGPCLQRALEGKGLRRWRN